MTAPDYVRLARHTLDIDDDGHHTPVSTDFVTKTDGGLETVAAHGATGSTETIDLADGNWHSLTLDDDCTVTVSGFTAAAGCSVLVKVTQDGTGGWGITWDGDIVFMAGADDQPAQAPGEVSFFILASDEGDTNIYGFPVGGGSGASSLDDLTDVTLTSPATADRLRFDGSVWRNSDLVWRPVMASDGTNYYVVVDGSGTAVMAEG